MDGEDSIGMKYQRMRCQCLISCPNTMDILLMPQWWIDRVEPLRTEPGATCQYRHSGFHLRQRFRIRRGDCDFKQMSSMEPVKLFCKPIMRKIAVTELTL